MRFYLTRRQFLLGVNAAAVVAAPLFQDRNIVARPLELLEVEKGNLEADGRAPSVGGEGRALSMLMIHVALD